MMKQYSLLFLLPILLVLAIIPTACGPASRLPCPEPGEVNAFADPGDGLVALTLENNICMSICVLSVSPDHCEYMNGVNWAADQRIRSGESVTRYVEPGKYAVWVEICTERFRADEGIKVYSDTVYRIDDDPVFGSKPPCGTSLTIVNNADVDICQLWISNTESAYASWNWLGAEPIRPGESLNLALRPDSYHIRAEDCDVNWMRAESDVQLSGHQTWTVP